MRRQTYGYLPSLGASPPFDQYQIILLGDRGTCVWRTCLRSLPGSVLMRSRTCAPEWPQDYKSGTLPLDYRAFLLSKQQRQSTHWDKTCSSLSINCNCCCSCCFRLLLFHRQTVSYGELLQQEFLQLTSHEWQCPQLPVHTSRKAKDNENNRTQCSTAN